MKRQAEAVTKPHYLALIQTAMHIYGRGDGRHGPIRILDVGCGNGDLLATLHALPYSAPVEFFGFEVQEHGAKNAHWLARIISRLAEDFPSTDWSKRIVAITEDSPWPFETHSFDLIVSSQVLEHVHDHNAFFSNLAKRLAPEGLSIHVFPPRQTIVEPHVRLLGAHWIKRHHYSPKLFTFLYRCSQFVPGFRKSKTRIKSAGSARAAASFAHEYLLEYENTPRTATLRRAADRVELSMDVGMSSFVFEESLRRLRLFRGPREASYSRFWIQALRPFRQIVGLFGVQVAVCAHKPLLKKPFLHRSPAFRSTQRG